jgi:F0F1-type ATP synthase assembly protein I
MLQTETLYPSETRGDYLALGGFWGLLLGFLLGVMLGGVFTGLIVGVLLGVVLGMGEYRHMRHHHARDDG